MNTNINLVKAALDKVQTNIDAGAAAARDEMMAAMIQLGQEEIKGKRVPGETATPDEPPMNRTGDLRRSITGQKFQEGFARDSAVVGPQTIYARAVELGGAKNWRQGLKFPYMAPAYKKFLDNDLVTQIFLKHLGG